MKKRSKEFVFNPEFKKVMLATDDELITMYVKGTNKYAADEMKIRGIY